MDKKNLQNILDNPFTISNWRDVLVSVFGVKRLHQNPIPIDINKKEKAEAAFELGSFNTSDDRIIGLYLVKVKPEVWLERNKVGLREMLRSVYKHDVDGALIVFEQKDKWRLSFVSEIRVFDENGKISKKSTEPKRYTYLLGSGEKVRTPATRLASLSGKPFSLEDIRNAFSVEALNEEFYKVVARYFYQLVGATEGKGTKAILHQRLLELPGIKPDNKEGHKVYQEFAVRLIGRTVFCWFLKVKKSDKGIALLPEHLLSSAAVATSNNYYHFILEKLFFQTLNTPMDARINGLPKGSDLIPFLNGGLFEPQIEDYYKPNRSTGLSDNLNTLKIPDSWFKEFFEHLEQYNFTIDENSVVDIEVSVDPEMLGRIFENLLAEIDPDSGETARKATGSFYTPREIVDYMATESLVHYLHNQTKIDKESLQPIFKMDSEVSFSKSETEKILEALDRVKILDPACGSGAFPIGVMQKIVMALQKLDKEAVWWKAKQIQRIENAILRNQVKQKLEQTTVEYARKIGIIQNSLYGVDIQPVAAEISKLRCFLTLVVDENIDETKPNRGVEPLPNLEFKFVTADALLKLPNAGNYGGLFNSNEDLELLQRVRLDYLQSYGHHKQELKDDFEKVRDTIAKQQLKLGKNIDVNGRAYKISSWNPFAHDKVDWFDPLWMYGETKFDIVIANPPYVQLQKENGMLANRYKSEGYKTFFKTGDIYCLFYERAFDLLNSNGTLAFITPNTWLQSITFSKLREFLSSNFVWLRYLITDKVFDATVDTNTVIFQKGHTVFQEFDVFKKDKRGISLSHKLSLETSQLRGNILNITKSQSERRLFEKIISISKPLSELFYVYNGVKPFEKGKGNPPQDEKVVNDKPFVFEGKKPSKEWLPLMRGSLMHRYKNLWTNNYWILYGEWLAAPRDPSIFEAKSKIIVRQTGDSIIATIIGANIICRNNLHIVLPKSGTDLKAILPILNSKLIDFVYTTINPERGEALAEVKKSHVEQLPIAPLNKIAENVLVTLSDYLLVINSLNDQVINEYVPNTHVSQVFEELVDAIVFELYFDEDFKKAGISFIKYVARDFKSIEGENEKEVINIIHAAYQKLREKDNEIRQNLKLMDTRLAQLIIPIKSAK